MCARGGGKEGRGSGGGGVTRGQVVYRGVRRHRTGRHERSLRPSEWLNWRQRGICSPVIMRANSAIFVLSHNMAGMVV